MPKPEGQSEVYALAMFLIFGTRKKSSISRHHDIQNRITIIIITKKTSKASQFSINRNEWRNLSHPIRRTATQKIGQATAIVYHAVSCHIHFLGCPLPSQCDVKGKGCKIRGVLEIRAFFHDHWLKSNLDFKQQNSIQNESNVG